MQHKASNILSAQCSVAQRGFTLLEVLVSISIFSVVALVSYSTLDTYVDQRQRLKTHYGKLEHLQRLFILLERDIEFIVPRNVRIGGDIESAIMSDNGDALISMTVAEADFRGASGVILKRVQWRLDGNELIRAEWDVLDQDGRVEPLERVISDEVDELTINYLIYSPTQGVNSKSQLAAEEFPDGVEILIKLKSGDSYRRVIGTAKGA